MSLKLDQLDAKLRARIEKQLAAEDAGRRDDSRRVEASQPKQDSAQALDSGIAKHQSSPRRVAVCVSFIALLRKPFDDDNLVASIKPLRDAVAATLGIDDGDKRISFQYQQLRTRGKETVLVHIETL